MRQLRDLCFSIVTDNGNYVINTTHYEFAGIKIAPRFGTIAAVTQKLTLTKTVHHENGLFTVQESVHRLQVT